MVLRRLLLVFVVALAGAFAPMAAFARTTDPDAALKGAIEELDAGRIAFDVPGMAVVVVVDGKVILARGFGQRGLDDTNPIDADTRFAIGSCSKAFTALGAALLAEDGKLSLTDRVGAHDPLLALSQPGALERLTITDLLSQRSGLARHDFLWHARPDMTRAQFAAAQAALAMQNTPGGRFGYTNSSLILAGRVIELRAGQSWEAFTTARIFTPLGMTRSNYSAAGLAADANAARATKRANGASRTVAWRDARLLGPAGAINATAHDMGQWLLMLTNDGALATGQPLVRPETLKTMWTPVAGPEQQRARKPTNDDDVGGYALGWRVGTWRGVRRISHSGAIDGFRARVTVFPDARIGIAVMANLGPTQIPDFATRVLAERLLDLPRKTDLMAYANARRAVETATIGKPAAPPRGRIARLGEKDPTLTPSAPLSALQGVYSHPAYGEIRIEPATEAQSLRIVFGVLHGRLGPWRGDSFIAMSDWPDDTLDEGEFVFRYAADGAVTGFTAMIDNDLAPIGFTRVGDLPPPLPTDAELTALPEDAPAAPTPGPATMLVLALGLAVLAAGATWAWQQHLARSGGKQPLSP
jgi:CubicO group peptidase (beta-lactamase class C family)